MPDDAGNDQGPVRIYEGASLTAKAPIPSEDVELVEDVTFKFFQDGEQFEEKTIPSSEGTPGDNSDADSGNAPVVVKHVLKLPEVPEDQESYTLDYHVFYTIKHPDGTTETLQNLAVSKFQVLPRTARLKVVWEKDDAAFPNFRFRVVQGGEQVGGIQSTFAADMQNAKGETVPAGTAEFNLGLHTGFRIVQESPSTSEGSKIK